MVIGLPPSLTGACTAKLTDVGVDLVTIISEGFPGRATRKTHHNNHENSERQMKLMMFTRKFYWITQGSE